MFEERFERLGMSEQENFKRIVNYFLAHTYLLQVKYDFLDNLRSTNPDYIFVERNFELFQEYLQYSGFQLERDNNYGVICLRSHYETNRHKFDKLTTLMVYVLRLIFEEEREKLSLSKDIFTSTGDLVHKMISLGVVNKKPADIRLRNSLRSLSRFRIIDKAEGAWENASTRLLILPTILFIISNERISNMYALLNEEIDSEEVDITEGEDSEEA